MEKIINKIRKEGVNWILCMAKYQYVEGFDAVVFYHKEKDTFFIEISNDPELCFDSAIEIFRFSREWIDAFYYDIEKYRQGSFATADMMFKYLFLQQEEIAEQIIDNLMISRRE